MTNMLYEYTVGKIKIPSIYNRTDFKNNGRAVTLAAFLPLSSLYRTFMISRVSLPFNLLPSNRTLLPLPAGFKAKTV